MNPLQHHVLLSLLGKNDTKSQGLMGKKRNILAIIMPNPLQLIN